MIKGECRKKSDLRCSFPVSVGDAERVMANLAIAFCEQEIGVDLVLLKSQGPYLRELPPGVCVFDLKAYPMLRE